MKCDRENFLTFWTVFCPFIFLTTQKIKIWKKNLKKYHFTHVYHKLKSYVWFLTYGARQTKFFVILDQLLPFYPTNNPENHNFEKMEKEPGDIIIFKG